MACRKWSYKGRNLEANYKGGARSEVFQKVPGGLCPLMSTEADEPEELDMVLIINLCWRQLPEAEFQRETKRPSKHVAGDHSSADTFLGANSVLYYGGVRLSSWAGTDHHIDAEIFLIIVSNIY